MGQHVKNQEEISLLLLHQLLVSVEPASQKQSGHLTAIIASSARE